MTKVKSWAADFTAGWQVKSSGVKPHADLIDAAALLAGIARKRPGFETFGACMAMRVDGVTMQQYLSATGAAGACINTIGDNPRNPLARAKLVQAKQTRNEAGSVVYTLALTAMAVKLLQAANPNINLDGVALVTPLTVKAAPVKAKPQAVKVEPAAPTGNS